MEESAGSFERLAAYRIDDFGMTEVVLKDFQNSWEYYKFNLEERREIVARIYNFVGFPIFAIGLIIYFVDNKILIYPDVNKQYPDISIISYGIGASTLLFLSIYGWLQIIALAVESRVSKDYLSFLNNVRHFVGVKSPNLRPFLKYNDFEIQTRILLTDLKFLLVRKSNFSDEIVSRLGAATRKESPQGFVGCILSMKGSYWRASSAILVVAVALGGATALMSKVFFPTDLEFKAMMTIGIIISLGAFLFGSNIFNLIVNK